jgi:hypothetical protein
MEIDGSNFGPDVGVVNMGSFVCGVSYWNHTKILCNIPPGEGVNLAVQIVQANVSASQSPVSQYVLNYIAPQITSFSAFAPRTEGGQVFVVQGTNFGRPFPGAGQAFSPAGPLVYISGVLCPPLVSTYVSVQCSFPAGEGKNLPVSIVVGGQTSTATVQVSYAAPVIYSVTPAASIPTNATATGANNSLAPLLMYVLGDNFGNNRLSVSIGELTNLYVRILSPDPHVYQNAFLNGTNHTVIVVPVPQYFGVNRTVTVVVGGGSEVSQTSNTNVTISYASPEISALQVVNVDGSSGPAYAGDTAVILPVVAFNASLSLGLADFGGSSGRRVLSDVMSYGFWATPNTSKVCQAMFQFPKVFWVSNILVAPNGQYQKTDVHYDLGQGNCAASEKTYVVEVLGVYYDVSVSPVLTCGGRFFEDHVLSAKVTLLSSAIAATFNSHCPCNSAVWQVGTAVDISACLAASCPYLNGLYFAPGVRYGSYVISNARDLYMTSTDVSGLVHAASPALRVPDLPTASVVAAGNSIGQPEGPTDGCFQWESLSDYMTRAQAIAAAQGVAVGSVPRICFIRALVQLSGLNLGSDVFHVPNALRVFLVNPANPSVQFEAATTTNAGLQSVVCPATDCVHTDSLVRFWVPPGIGTNLQIILQVGNQQAVAGARFSYLPPAIAEVTPGSVSLFDPFMDADGVGIVVRGTNFGGTPTNATIVLNGRVCTNTTWNSGAQTDEQGLAFLTCTTQRDVVGPRGVILCVASQVYVYPLYRSDGPVLIAGDKAGAWIAGTHGAALGYNHQLKSVALAWCEPGAVGGLYELCRPCPAGAICANSSLTDVRSDVSFFATTYNIYNSDGTLNPLAVSSCDSTTWNASLVEQYPDLIQRTTCEAYLACEPASSCIGNNTCGVGYEYAMYQCLRVRGYANKTDWATLTRQQVNGTANSCKIYQDPYTAEWVGDDVDCMGATVPNTACPSSHPEQCSTCQVLVEPVTNIRYGVCACSLPSQCALCTMYEYYLLNNKCQSCPANPALLIAMLFVAAFLIAGAAYYMSKKNINMAFITIGIDYLQVLAIFSTTQVTWPALIQELFNAMAIFNFSIDIAAPECLSPNLPFQAKWYAQEMIPLALLAILLAIHVVYSLMKWRRWGEKASYTTHISSLVAVFVISMYFLYLVLTKNALDIFNCNPIINPITGMATDAYTYATFTSMDCDGGGRCRCGDPGGVQMQLQPLAILFLVMYTFGFPAFIAYVLWNNHMLVIEDQYLRAKGVGTNRATNPDCYDMRKRYSKLYFQFKPRFAPYWILLLITRKFWVAFAALMFRGSPSFQLAVILLVLFGSLVLQVLCRPFLSTRDYPEVVKDLDAMAERSIMEPSFAIYREIQTRVEMAARLDVRFRRRKRQQQMGVAFLSTEAKSASGRKLRASVSVAAARYFTDLNTLEFFLLGAGILICLAGIMFQAAVTDTRALVAQQVSVVTILLVIVIVVSLAYFILFFLAEVMPQVISSCLNVLRRTKNNDEDLDEYVDTNVTLQENPMFSAPKIVFADNRVLEEEIAASMKLLQQAEQHNKALRDELKNKKMAAQLSETAAAGPTYVKAEAQTGRKEFAQTRLATQLTGPQRQRAVKKSDALTVAEEEEGRV